MKRKILTIVVVLVSAFHGRGEEEVLSTASSTSVSADTTFVDGASISSSLKIDYSPFWWDTECSVTLNEGRIAILDEQGRVHLATAEVG